MKRVWTLLSAIVLVAIGIIGLKLLEPQGAIVVVTAIPFLLGFAVLDRYLDLPVKC